MFFYIIFETEKLQSNFNNDSRDNEPFFFNVCPSDDSNDDVIFSFPVACNRGSQIKNKK